MSAHTIARSIPTTVVPFRYSVTFIDSTTPLDFGTDRASLVQWVTERTDALGVSLVLRVARAEASEFIARAEAEGQVEGSTRGMAYLVEAWQHATLQGEAEDLVAYLADIAPVGTPVTAGDAMNRNVEYLGRIAEHTASTLRVAWLDGSSTEGSPLDMARVLTIDDDGDVAWAERAQADQAEADTIAEAARTAVAQADAERTAREADRLAYLAAHPEHSANFDAAPLVLDVPATVHRRDTYRARTAAADALDGFRFAFRTTSAEGRYVDPMTDDGSLAVVDPGWTAHDPADRALAYVVDTLRVSERVALAAMLTAAASSDPWEFAAPVLDARGSVQVWCSAVAVQN